MKRFFVTAITVIFVGAAFVFFAFYQPSPTQEKAYTQAYYSPVSWHDVPPNGSEDASLRQAILRSCRVLLEKPPQTPFLPERQTNHHARGGDDAFIGANTTVRAWWPFCRAINKAQKQGNVFEVSTYSLFKKYLQPYVLKEKSETLSHLNMGKFWPKTHGLFTGYYEPVLSGSHIKTEVYNVPLHGRPDDVVKVDLGRFDARLKGRRIVGRVEDGELLPYHDHAAIAGGALKTKKEKNPPILWLKNPVDKFFLQIQGSGRVRLPDGNFVFVGYAGSNGHPYTAIGRYLVAQEHMTLAEVSMQRIRTWLEAHPDKMTKVLHQNKSYVFFRIREDGPYGTQNVLLTPETSLAVDRRVVPLGAPVFLDTTTTSTGKPFRRFMVAQDTGGAIKGGIRGDIYFGHGQKAARLAGRQKSDGRLFVLLPKEISVTGGG